MCCLAPGAAGGWADGCSSTTQLGAMRTQLKIAQTETIDTFIYLQFVSTILYHVLSCRMSR